MRAVDEANTEVQRSRILDAATRCLERKGIAKTSINDICREADMRPGHLYYYFPSKDAVLEAVVTRDRDTVLDLIANMFDGPDIAGQIVDVHIRAHDLRVSYGLSAVSRIELSTYFSRMSGQNDPASAEHFVLFRVMRDATLKAIADGRLPRDLDVEPFVDAVALVWQGLSYSRIADIFDINRLTRAARLLLEGRLVGND